jgi:hypothetical protein
MIKSFIAGIRHASASWKMILLLLVASLLLSLPLAAPIFLLVSQTSGGTLLARRLLADQLDVVWLTDLFNEQIAGFSLATISLQLGLLTLVIGGAYLLLNTLLTGGILEVYASEDRRFTMRKFFSGGGAYFWRFFRLLLISLIYYGLAVGVYALLVWRIRVADRQAAVEQPGVLKNYAAGALLLLLLAVANMIFDYAKIGAVTGDRRKMFRETLRAAPFPERVRALSPDRRDRSDTVFLLRLASRPGLANVCRGRLAGIHHWPTRAGFTDVDAARVLRLGAGSLPAAHPGSGASERSRKRRAGG